MTTPSETYEAFSSLPLDARVFSLARPGTVLRDGKIATGKEPMPGTNGHHDAQPAAHVKQIGNYGWSLDAQFLLVDFDVEHPNRAAWEAKLTPTWMQQTRRGTHRVYRVPAGFTGRNRKIIVRGDDGQQAIIGDLKSRGYLVGPGSVVAGHVYAVLDARDPQIAPPWLLEMALEQQAAPPGDEFQFKVDGTLQERHKIELGSNDDELIKIAGFLRRRGFAEDAIAVMLYGVMNSGVLEQDPAKPPYTAADARRLARSASTWDPGADNEVDAAIRPEAWVNGADVSLVEAPVTYWLRRFVPKAALVLMYGPGGIGKTSWVSWLTALVSQAGGKVLHVGIEDPFRLFLARAVLHGADRSKFFSLQSASRLQFPRDAKKLYEAIIESGVDFVYLDSVYSHFGNVEGSPINERTRQSLGPLAEIAQITGCTIFGTFHENKGGTYMGSTEMVNVARCVLRASREERKPFRVKVDKTNDPAGPPDYFLEHEGIETVWTDPVTGETQMEEDDDGALTPIKLVLASAPKRVLKSAVRLDEIEPSGDDGADKKEAIARLHAQGLTPREIGSEVGLTDRHIRRLLKDLDL